MMSRSRIQSIIACAVLITISLLIILFLLIRSKLMGIVVMRAACRHTQSCMLN